MAMELNSFKANSLVKCFEQLSVEPLTPALHEEKSAGFAHHVAEHPMEFLPDVPGDAR